MGEKVYIVIPAYNEAKSIGKVLRKLKRSGYHKIIVVDDGSKDRTSAISNKQRVIVLKHIINRGLGGALGTGIKAAVEENADVIVTFDSDGQHSVSDIKKVTTPILNGEADVVIGSRIINKKEHMPVYKKVGNFGLNMITFILYGVYCSDTQSGLRAFSKEAAQKLEIKSNGYEVSSEIIKEVGKNKFKLKEIPIKTIYTDYSIKRGTNLISGIRILIKLSIDKFFR